MKGERYYQALIDLVAEDHRDFDEVARSCGFDSLTLLACFDGAPDITHEELFDHLGREQINKSAEVLKCSRIRIFFLADVFSIGDIKDLAIGMNGGSPVGQEGVLRAAARYAEDLRQSGLFNKPERLFEEFIAATFSEDLEEACRKMRTPCKRMMALRSGGPGSLKDYELLVTIATTIGIPLAVVLLATQVVEEEDLVWDGKLVDPMEELKAVLDVEIW